MVSLTTYVGWAGVIGVAGGYWYFQKNRGRARRRGRSTTTHTSRGGETRRAGVNAKKDGYDAGHSSADQGNTSQDGRKKNKRKQKVKGSAEAELSRPSPVDSGVSAIEADINDDEMDNREFARQLQSAKSGTVLASHKQTASRQKSVKQSKAADKTASIPADTNGEETSFSISAPSSSTGVDGDDDLSAANSPNLVATSSNGATDVSDMLEQPAAGPSVLRITESNDPAVSKKQKKAAAPVVTETKKQRQNRKKAEEKKAAREEEEKERKVLLEKQRRTAREAEGRAAKDGSSFMAAKAPASSAWTAPAVTNNGTSTSPISKIELLDTYEPLNNVSNLTEAAFSDTAKPNGKWAGDLPSEEEQLRLLREENEWATVGNKKGRKSATSRLSEKQLSDTSTSANANGKSLSTPIDQTVDVKKSELPDANASQKENRKVHEVELEYTVGGKKVNEIKYLQDSEWDV